MINWTLETKDFTYYFELEYELIPGERPCRTHNGVAPQVKSFFAKCVRIVGEHLDWDKDNILVPAVNDWMQREYSEQIEEYILDRLV